MVERLGSEHHEIVVHASRTSRTSFPRSCTHTERPILRTAPAPLFLLSQLVRETGIKVVLTGEGADEMFAGYDLFREGKVRRFWARQPAVDDAPAPARAALSVPRALAGRAAGDGAASSSAAISNAGADAGLRARARAGSTTAALQAAVHAGHARAMASRRRCHRRLLADAAGASSRRWTPLAQDQYLEVRTLLSGYLLSSQGDRMLMAHSVEGRFPFLDSTWWTLADSLPPSYKLRGARREARAQARRGGPGPGRDHPSRRSSRTARRTRSPSSAPDAPAWVADTVERAAR